MAINIHTSGAGAGDGYGYGAGDGQSAKLVVDTADNNLFTSVFLAQQRPSTALLLRTKRKMAA